MYELYPDQKAISDQIVEFYETPGVYILLLEGFPGVGKSTTIQHALKRIQERHPTITMALTAPTHKAVKVLKRMAKEEGLDGVDFLTLHASLGLVLDDSSGEVKHTRKAANGSFETCNLVGIDECSQINLKIWKEVEYTAMFSKVKVVLMGDNYQAPPVGEEESLSFSRAQIKCKLSIIRRQEEGNPILELGASHRADIRDGTLLTPYNTSINPDLGKGVYVLKGKDWMDSFKENFVTSEYADDPDAFRVICYTNRRVNSINKMIRKQLVGITDTPYIVGERVATRKPISREIYGEYEPLAHTDEEGVLLDIQYCQHPKYLKTSKQFNVWSLRMRMDSNKIAETFILDESSVRDYWNIHRHLKMQALDAQAKGDRSMWKAWHAFQESFGDVVAPHAMTIHKSQGSTFKNVFLDLYDCMSNHNVSERRKLLNVACSRASDNLLILKG